jgi:hypothetical protein
MEQASVTSLDSLSGQARVWVFQSSKPLIGSIRTEISMRLLTFLKDWAAHGKQLFAAFEIHHDRFMVIAVDEAVAQATGCSVDKLMRVIQEMDETYQLALLDRMKVAYWHGDQIVEVGVNDFTAMLENGKASGSTMVFNNVVQTLSEWRSAWETTVEKSWHRNLLPR